MAADAAGLETLKKPLLGGSDVRMVRMPGGLWQLVAACAAGLDALKKPLLGRSDARMLGVWIGCSDAW